MEEPKENTSEAPIDNGGGSDIKRTYERSTIEFPYNDLNDAIEVVSAIHQNAGTECDLDALAAFMRQSMTSGAFRARVANAGTFRLTENDRGKVRLTEFGRMIFDAEQEQQARAESFLSVPLYQKIFERYKGYTLPHPAALERELVSFGVAPKQTDKARQAFMRSARQAGFFAVGEDRLVRPQFSSIPTTMPLEVPVEGKTKEPRFGGSGGGGEGSASLDLDPLLIELLRKIPLKDGGWEGAKRLRWFRTFAMNVSQVYDDDDEPVELKIDLDEPSVHVWTAPRMQELRREF
jgi:hypothetical protein